jgi:hypothetical protein
VKVDDRATVGSTAPYTVRRRGPLGSWAATPRARAAGRSLLVQQVGTFHVMGSSFNISNHPPFFALVNLLLPYVCLETAVHGATQLNLLIACTKPCRLSGWSVLGPTISALLLSNTFIASPRNLPETVSRRDAVGKGHRSLDHSIISVRDYGCLEAAPPCVPPWSCPAAKLQVAKPAFRPC